MGSLRGIAALISIPREKIERTFVSTGAGLSEGAAMLHRISKVLGALESQLQSPSLSNAAESLAEVGRRASEISSSFAIEQEQINQLGVAVGEAGHPISSLQRSVKMMDIIAVNARVVAASIVGDRDDFAVFTHDIAHLSKSANASIQAFTSAYRQLTEDVAEAGEQHGRFQAAHSNTLISLAAGLNEALEDVASQRALAAEGGAATRRTTTQIIARISSAVMALQVGDSTRQRLEHIETAIHAMCDINEDEGIGEIDRLLCVSELGRLQEAQLADTVDNFEAEVGEASAALDSLAEDAVSILQHSREIYASDTGGSVKASPLASLTSVVGIAVRTLQDCEAARSQLEGKAAAVLGTVAILMEHVQVVQEIEANMRLVSLNAAVKCAQLGPDGAPLNVIARLLRELTGETVLSAEAAMTKLTRATVLAKSFCDAANSESTARIAQLEVDASAALRLLTTVDGSLSDAKLSLENEGAKTIALLDDASRRFATQASIAEDLRDQQFALVAECPRQDAASNSTLSDALKSHWQNYTMDAERRIHENLFGSGLPANASQSSTPVGDDLDDIFF